MLIYYTVGRVAQMVLMLDNRAMTFAKSARKRQILTILGGAILLAIIGLLLAKPWEGGGPKAIPAAATPEARNDLRRQHLKLMANAVTRYQAELGALPVAAPAQATGICTNTGAPCKAAGLVDLTILSSRGYIDALPSDPVGGRELRATGYTFGKDAASGSLVFGAPRAESGQVIIVTVP
jgi:hypothetical protein